MKKRILFIINSLHGGGAEKVLQTLINNLDYAKYEITLYSLIKGNIEKYYPNQIKYKFIYNKFDATDSFIYKLYVRLINKFIQVIYEFFPPSLFYTLFIRGKYDTEVAFIEGYSTRIISGSTNKESKKIAWVHIDLKQNHWTKIAYKNFKEELNSYQKFNQVVCVSNSVCSSFKELFPSTDNVIVKYNPIDDAKIKSLGSIGINNSYNNKDELQLISIGRLTPQKGYDRLLPIIYKLKKEGYNLKINILGDGPDRDKLEKYIYDNKLNNIVNLLGFCHNPYPYIKKADLFVCSSRSEGYSTVITEALILGIPIITTDCAGMKELLGNNEYGYITSNDNESLYNGLKELLSTNILYDHYKVKAKERGLQFRLESLMKEIETIL